MITARKQRELRERIAQLGIDLEAIEERFVRGGGPGGQKVNKSANAVVLRYPPLGLVVRCQRERSLALNRFLALRELVERIASHLRPESSPRLREHQRRRRRKQRRQRRQARRRNQGSQG